MEKMNVKIVKFAPIKVASFQATGESPVFDALGSLHNWAKPKGLLNNMEENPIFGFDCELLVGKRKSPGYEAWIKIPPYITPEPFIKTKEFAGGLFLTTTCRTEGNRAKAIQVNWAKLNRWGQENGFEMANQQFLERFYSFPLSDNFTIDLYHPIKINIPGTTEDQYIRMINGIEEDTTFKKLNTEQKINKLKERINMITEEIEDKRYAKDIDEIKYEFMKVKEEIKNLKEIVNSLKEKRSPSELATPIQLNCQDNNCTPYADKTMTKQ
jgi:DNA gyrase inhibitor GyrI